MQKKLFVPVNIILAISIVLMATDIYLPCLVEMAEYYEVKSNIIQYSLAVNMLAITISGFFYGPISDRIGRKKVMLFGMIIFAIFSICCAFATNAYWLNFFRFMQGLGGGVSSVIGVAMVRDLYHKDEMAQLMSKLSMAIVFSPILAQILGGYLATIYDWRACFIFIAILSVLVILLQFFFLIETHPKEAQESTISFKKVTKDYIIALSDKTFFCYSLVLSALFCAMFAYIVVAPYVFIEKFNVSKIHFGYYTSLILISTFSAGGLIHRKVRDWGLHFCAILGIASAMLSGLLILGFTLLGVTMPLVYAISFMAFSFGMSILMSTITTLAMNTEIAKTLRGTASSVLTTMRMLFSFIGAAMGGLFQDNDFFSTSIFMTAIMVIAMLVFFYVDKDRAMKTN